MIARKNRMSKAKCHKTIKRYFNNRKIIINVRHPSGRHIGYLCTPSALPSAVSGVTPFSATRPGQASVLRSSGAAVSASVSTVRPSPPPPPLCAACPRGDIGPAGVASSGAGSDVCLYVCVWWVCCGRASRPACDSGAPAPDLYRYRL